MAQVEGFFVVPFQGVLCLFLLELGLVADLVAGLRRVPLAALQPPPAALAGHLRGLTAERLAVLDLAAILSDPRQIVDEEVDA